MMHLNPNHSKLGISIIQFSKMKKKLHNSFITSCYELYEILIALGNKWNNNFIILTKNN